MDGFASHLLLLRLKGFYVIMDGLATHLLHLRLKGFYVIMDGLAMHLLLLRLKGFYVVVDGLVAHLLLLRLKGGFALLRPPRGPPKFHCPSDNLIKIAVLNNFYFAVLNNFYFCVKMMVGQMVFLFLRLKGGFALLRPPRGPPEHVCPFGANEQEARPWISDEKAS